MAALNRQADVAVEAYDAGQLALAAARRHVAAVDRRAAAAGRALASEENQAGQLAAAVYQEGGVGSFGALLSTSNPGRLLTELGDLAQVAQSGTAQLAALRAAQEQVAQLQRAASQAQAAASARAAALARTRSRILTLLSTQRALLAHLQARQRAEVLAAASPAPAAAPPAAIPADASAIARIALAAAYSAIGRPYQWGAAGPDAFDCSGLMLWAFAHAGVSLPHSAAAQYGYGTHVPISQLQPGDIVFFSEGGYIGHNGIYIGNGEMIDAPHTGSFVGIHQLYPGLIGGTRL